MSMFNKYAQNYEILQILSLKQIFESGLTYISILS